MKFNLEKVRQNALIRIAMDIFQHRNRLLEILKQPEFEDSDVDVDEDNDLATEDVDGVVAAGTIDGAPVGENRTEDSDHSEQFSSRIRSSLKCRAPCLSSICG